MLLFPLSRANYKQANMHVIQAKLSDIQVSLNNTYISLFMVKALDIGNNTKIYYR